MNGNRRRTASSYAEWARENVHFHPATVVEVNGHYPKADVIVRAQFLGPAGPTGTEHLCPAVRLSSESIVVLIPTENVINGVHPHRATLRLRLLDLAGNETDRLDLPLRGGTSGATPATVNRQISSLLDALGPSLLRRAIAARQRDGMGAREAYGATSEDAKRIAALLKEQWSQIGRRWRGRGSGAQKLIEERLARALRYLENGTPRR